MADAEAPNPGQETNGNDQVHNQLAESRQSSRRPLHVNDEDEEI